ncbi:phosphate regulon sensor histidine kinase PhoR [Idiomarina xiamenensis]|uniref:histidine kinase n=1 Tax=Idiomarina xiamenensis 10-D-4 TaxID=740709 RepID=K2KYJ8_9GAMM|nr:phosphate regulon sensor histidine kinase PhoR [Idiomarina xiamenensis]EKE87619.1 phosphate regulon sensor histidine kinase [Idiomarina xiamenensis 10-D-4]
MDNNFSALFLIRGLLIYLAPFILVGALLDQLWLALSIGLLLLTVWNYFFKLKLIRWLWRSRTIMPPSAPGSWSYIYEGIYRTQRRSQHRRRALARILRRFREASEAIPDAAVVFRADGSLLWSNKLAQFHFGLRWPSDAGIRLSNLIRHPEFVSYLNKGDFREAITIPSPVREHAELEIRIMPYSDDQFMLIARDVTQLRQLERMRKDFVANVSHELKTPLTVLQGYLEMMDEPASMPPTLQKKAVGDMYRQSERMRNLVNQLLVLSRMDSAARGDIFERKVGMPQLLRQIQSEMQPLAQQRQQQLLFNIAELDMYGREDELRSAIVNLVSNAINYTQEGGEITVNWRKVGQQAELSVSDNGAGIASQHLPRLTERFYRVDSDRNSASGGTGLGLSIVKHALEHHHSQLQVSSKEGVGSRFWFRISAELMTN